MEQIMQLKANEIEAMERIAERFDILEDMAQAVKEGDVRSMIVVGPPGVGKSYGVQRKLEEASLVDAVAGQTKYQVVKGAMTALGLYAKLYEFSEAGCVLVFDDCDSVLMDDLSLNIREGIPNKFDFKGGVIFITNLKFDNIKSKKLQDHLGALQSRCHYIDLTLDTEHDKYLRIVQIAQTGKLFTGYNLESEQQTEILDFMRDNAKRFREMSLRTALKLADLRKSQPARWQRVAEVTVMKNR